MTGYNLCFLLERFTGKGGKGAGGEPAGGAAFVLLRRDALSCIEIADSGRGREFAGLRTGDRARDLDLPRRRWESSGVT